MKNLRFEVLCGLLILCIIYYYEVFRFNQLSGKPHPFTLTLHSDIRSEDCCNNNEEIQHQIQEKINNESSSFRQVDEPNIFEIQMDRQQRLRRECLKIRKQEKKRPEGKNMNMIYSDKASVIYCYVPKVACTNWKRVFQVFYGKYKTPMAINKKKDVIHLLHYKFLHSLDREEMDKKRQLYYSFLISRHPFERVVSAYRNKLRSPYGREFQHRYGSAILRLYRLNLTKQEYAAGENVTFPEFTQYLIRQHAKFGSAGLDEHWRDTYSLCNMCHMKYDYIGDMTTLIADSNHILKQLDWQDKVKFPSNATDKYKVPTTDITKSHFQQLQNTTVQRLYKIYKKDFDIFGYDVSDFFS